MNHNPKPRWWKMALLTWLTIYPLINLLFFVLMPHIGHLHNLLKTLIFTMIMVPIMTYLLPRFQQKLYPWLVK